MHKPYSKINPNELENDTFLRYNQPRTFYGLLKLPSKRQRKTDFSVLPVCLIPVPPGIWFWQKFICMGFAYYVV